MTPRANWDKLIPAFNFESWSTLEVSDKTANNNFPVMVSYYANKSGKHIPDDVIQEILAIEVEKSDDLISGKFVALQTHIRIRDSANSLRLAKELLMITSSEESPLVFVAKFVRDLLAR